MARKAVHTWTSSREIWNIWSLLVLSDPPPCLPAREWRMAIRCRIVLPESPAGTTLGKEKSLKVTSLRGPENPEIENLHLSAAISLLLQTTYVFCKAGTPSAVIAPSPLGSPKVHRCFAYVLVTFQMGFGRPQKRPNDPTDDPRCPKGTPWGSIFGSDRVGWGRHFFGMFPN